MKIAVTHPGKLGDAAYCLPTVRHIAKIMGDKVDFWTSKLCSPILPLVKNQSYINDVFIAEKYQVHHTNCGVQPWAMQIDKPYDRVWHMGFRSYPDCRLVDYFPTIYGFTLVDTTIKYDFIEQPKDEDYIVIATNRNPNLKPLFIAIAQELAQKKNVYIVGPKNEQIYINSPKVKNLELGMLETLPVLSNANLFVGNLSANLVLANGFPDLKKIVLVEPERHCPVHDIWTDKHHYLVSPTLEGVLELCE